MDKSVLKIVVASQNPVKIGATKQAFQLVFPHSELHLEGINISSGVSDQPQNDMETWQGAINRCQGAKEKIAADFWVGIEGGIDKVHNNIEAFAWMVIEDKKGRKGEARSASFSLPPAVVSLLQKGIELGVANDQVFQRIQSKKKGGAVGILTDNIIDRTELYKHALVLALIPFIQEELFSSE